MPHSTWVVLSDRNFLCFTFGTLFKNDLNTVKSTINSVVGSTLDNIT